MRFEGTNLFLQPTPVRGWQFGTGSTTTGGGTGGVSNAEIETEDGNLLETEDGKAIKTET